MLHPHPTPASSCCSTWPASPPHNTTAHLSAHGCAAVDRAEEEDEEEGEGGEEEYDVSG
jgi:hypothetical protein